MASRPPGSAASTRSAELAWLTPGSAATSDAGDLVAPAEEEALGLVGGERGEGGAGHAVGARRTWRCPTTVDLHRVGDEHGGRAADVGGRRRRPTPRSITTSPAAAGARPSTSCHGLSVGSVDPVPADGRRAVAADPVAVGAEQLRRALRPTVRRRRRRRRPATCDRATRGDRRPARSRRRRSMRCSLRTSDAVPPFASVKSVAEAAADGVAEHERAGEERHAQHHRGEHADEPSLAAPEVLEA